MLIQKFIKKKVRETVKGKKPGVKINATGEP